MLQKFRNLLPNRLKTISRSIPTLSFVGATFTLTVIGLFTLTSSIVNAIILYFFIGLVSYLKTLAGYFQMEQEFDADQLLEVVIWPIHIIYALVLLVTKLVRQ